MAWKIPNQSVLNIPNVTSNPTMKESSLQTPSDIERTCPDCLSVVPPGWAHHCSKDRKNPPQL